MNDIYKMLKEDGEDFLADRYREAFTEQTPDHVVLMLKDGDVDVVGAAYYQVSPSIHPSFGALTARAFGVHFRPNASLSQKEQRRYLQTVIASMKQLGVDFTFGRFSSRNFATIVQLVAEGFEYGSLAELRLVKSV